MHAPRAASEFAKDRAAAERPTSCPGVAEAQGSAIPLVCLTSDTPVSQHQRGVLTELDQESLFRPVTKWNTRINSSSTVAEMTRRAIRMATVGRPGAVHLSLPTDSPGRRNRRPLDLRHSQSLPGPGGAHPSRSGARRAAARSIESAPRPVIVAGGGVVTGQAWDELTRFAETLNIPVATSINGKGSIAETSRVSIGIVGGNGARAYTNDVVSDADLIIYIGSRTDSTTTHHWSVPRLRDPPAVIQIDVEPFEIGNNYKLAVPLAGDAGLLVDRSPRRDRRTEDGRRRAIAIGSTDWSPSPIGIGRTSGGSRCRPMSRSNRK